MQWLDLILKLFPTLISIIKSIIEAIQKKDGADASFAAASSDQVVCDGIDKICAALQAAKPQA